MNPGNATLGLDRRQVRDNLINARRLLMKSPQLTAVEIVKQMADAIAPTDHVLAIKLYEKFHPAAMQIDGRLTRKPKHGTD